MSRQKQIAIVGGGASGMMAAIAAAGRLREKHNDGCGITIFEKMDRMGRKLLATGNGRCNITNMNAGDKYYHGQREYVGEILSRFTVEDTLAFFESMGLYCRIEQDGKVYPYSYQASSVLDVLRLELEKRRIKVRTGQPVIAAIPGQRRFLLRTDSSVCRADAVILATGGLSAPHLGGGDAGESLLRSLGHTLYPGFPAIVQVKTDTKWVKQLAGIKIQGRAGLYRENKLLREEQGEILFTDYGLSGPPVLQLSRIVSISGDGLTVRLDIMPDYSTPQVERMVEGQCGRRQDASLQDLFTGLLNKRVGQVVLKSLAYSLQSPVAGLSAKDRSDIVAALKAFTIPVRGVMGFKQAQVTAGGANLSEFDHTTLMSRLHKNLFCCGEGLNVDGDCGGFNLQWAWSTGYVAGRAVADQI